MEVSVVYNFTLSGIPVIGNTCPIGTDDDFIQFGQVVKDYNLALANPCPFPVSIYVFRYLNEF